MGNTGKRLWGLLVLVSPLCGYLEWGGGNSAFLIQMEYDAIHQLVNNFWATLHPLVLLPLAGQLLLVIFIFQKHPKKQLLVTSILLIGLLFGFIFIAGIISMRLQIVLSTIPFFLSSFCAIRYNNILNNSRL